MHQKNYGCFDYGKNLKTPNLSPMLGQKLAGYRISLIYLWVTLMLCCLLNGNCWHLPHLLMFSLSHLYFLCN